MKNISVQGVAAIHKWIKETRPSSALKTKPLNKKKNRSESNDSLPRLEEKTAVYHAKNFADNELRRSIDEIFTGNNFIFLRHSYLN
jgi:hypothetical protein